MTTARWLAALLAITALGAALRFSVMETTHPVSLVGDEYYYLAVARSIAAGQGHHSDRLDAWAAWPPGQAFWLSRFIPANEGPFALLQAPRSLVAAQVFLGSLLVFLVGALGCLLADRRVGLVAAMFAAVLPELVAFSHYLWPTTLFSVLCLASWCCVVLARQRQSLAFAAAAGAVFGLAVLTRETAAAMALGGAVWLLWHAAPGERRGAALRSGVMLALCVLVVLPWTLRNFERIGRLVPVSTVGWMAAREGNTLSADDWMQEDHEALSAFRLRYYALSETQRIDVARSEAIALVLEEQPTWLLRKTIRNLAWLFSPDSFLLHKLSYEAYGKRSLGEVRTLLVLSVSLYALAFVLGTLGLTLGRSAGAGSFAIAVAAPLLVLHVLANASPRYRVPLLPLLLIGSGVAACQWRSLAARLRHPRAIPAVAILLFFLWFSVPSFAPDAAKLWARGTVFELR